MTISPIFSPEADKRQWKAELARSFRKLEDLLAYCQLDPRLPAVIRRPGFSFRVTRHYASLIEKDNPRDPLLLQVLPLDSEQLIVPGYHRDAVGDGASLKAPGLIHKYHGRALLTMTGACAIHCRYCFRRHFPYSENRPGDGFSGEAIEYLAEHRDISEVILSGGDPLMLSDSKLMRLIDALNRLKHVRILRLHSRLLSVLPERVNEGLLDTLQNFNGEVVLVTHVNHPNEISALNAAAFQRLAARGHRLFNQSVMLKGINDCAKTLISLSYKLFENQVTPYYLHRLDKVQGAAHFDLSKHESCRIYKDMVAALPGYLLPAMVEEIAGQPSKTRVDCR